MGKIELKPIPESRKATIVRKALSSVPQQRVSKPNQKGASNDINEMLNRAFKAVNSTLKY